MLRPTMRLADAKRRLRQLRWFDEAFRSVASEFEHESGVRVEIDPVALARAFFNWLDALNAVGPFVRADPADRTLFAAGLVLRELVGARPAFCAARPGADDLLYARFCMAAVAAIDIEEQGHARPLDACAQEPRFWASYRENVAVSPDAAIAFLDRLHGAEPVWEMPLSVAERAATRRLAASPSRAALTAAT